MPLCYLMTVFHRFTPTVQKNIIKCEKTLAKPTILWYNNKAWNLIYGEVLKWSKRRDSKSRRALTRRVGSNPTFSANKNRTFVYRQMFCFCLSKPQAWYIIECITRLWRDIHSYIISPFGAVSHHAPACIYLRLDDIQCLALMIYRNKLRMIYKAEPWFICDCVV